MALCLVMNLLKCRRCGTDIRKGPRDTNRTFCGADCRDTWWNEFRTKGVARGALQDRRNWKKNITPVHLTETQAVWLAAILDGEGSISIYREQRRGNASGYRYKAVVTVSNTNTDLICKVNDLMQGFALKKDKRPSHHKECYRSTAHGRNVEAILRATRPHLIAKKEQADLVLEFCEVMKSAPMRTSAVHEIFERLWREVQTLNRRGVAQEV